VVPAVFLLGGMLLQQAGRLLSLYPQKLRLLALGLILALTGFLNFKIYFHDFVSGVPPRSFDSDAIAREIKAAGPEDDVFLLGQPHLSVKYGTIRFLAGDTAADVAGSADIPTLNGQGLLVIALPDQVDNLATIEQRIPGGILSTRVNQRNDPIYTVYHVTARPELAGQITPASQPVIGTEWHEN
jgi:hypothetical protein